MGKRSRLKAERRRLREASLNTINAPTQATPKNKWGAKSWTIVVSVSVVISIIGGLTFIDPIKHLLRSKSDNFKADNSQLGEFNPPKINRDSFKSGTENVRSTYRDTSKYLPPIDGIYMKNLNSEEVRFDMASIQFGVSVKALEKGCYVGKNLTNFCNDVELSAKLIGKRLYIGAQFKSIVNEEVMGIIDFQKWQLFNANLLNFSNDDNRLQAWDKNGNIAIAINYVGGNAVELGGYLIGPNDVWVLHNKGYGAPNGKDCYSKQNPNWKKDVEKAVKENVRSIF